MGSSLDLLQYRNSPATTNILDRVHQLTKELSDYVGTARWAKAVETLQSLIDLEPANTHYYLRMGDYSLKAGNRSAAIHYYYAAADMYVSVGFTVKAIATYKMILKIAPAEQQAKTLMQVAEAQKARIIGQEPEHSEILQRCLQSYHDVTTARGGQRRKDQLNSRAVA